MRGVSRWSVACAALLALALSVPAAGAEKCAATPQLEGTWLVKAIYHYGSLGFPDDRLQYFQHFDRDGRAAIYLPHNPGDLPYDESRNACVGEWRPRGPRTFDVTLYCLWSTAWETAPSVPDRIRIKVVLDKKGKTWTATPFYYEQWVGGKYDPFDTWGEMDGQRLGIAPVE
jgi:hypothetical protein